MIDDLPEGEDIFCLISESERVRIVYQLINRIKLATLKNTNSAFDSEEHKRLEHSEGLLDFFKRLKMFKDITALHSRSRAVYQMHQFRRCQELGEA